MPDFVDSATEWVAAHPVPVLIVIGILALIILGRYIAANAKRDSDPTRMYTKNQRNDGFTRATNRCELDGFLWFRCRRPAEHGDHFFPWSKGGATSMSNFVAACGFCNMSKGAKQPSRSLGRRIRNRRRRYFPAGLPRDAGEWFR